MHLLGGRFCCVQRPVALKFGLASALVAQELAFRQQENKQKWVDATVESLHKALPLSKSTIERSLSNLRQIGLIEVRKAGGYDRSNLARVVHEHPELLKLEAELLGELADNAPGLPGGSGGSGAPVDKSVSHPVKVTEPIPSRRSSPFRQNDGMEAVKVTGSLMKNLKNLGKNPERSSDALKSARPDSENLLPLEVRMANIRRLRESVSDLIGPPSSR